MAGPALHEFIVQNTEELRAMCVARMRQVSPDRSDEQLTDDFATVMGEMVAALQHEAGLPTRSPLPGRSEAARRHGGERQHRGYAITKIALDFGSISDSVGELAASKGISFQAREYQVLDLCVDTAVASALEAFWDEAQRQQEDANTERIGFLAHELRNALSTARMSFAILQRGDLGVNGKTGRLLDRSLRRLEDLTSQTLLEVQLRAGAKPETRRLAVGALLENLEEAAVPERDIRVSVEVEDGLEVDADERLLASAISNLLQNAMKFTHAGGRVTLRGRRDGDDVVIEVEDECGGLPPGKEEELFSPYVQRSSDRRGLGLGLAITREAIEAHGGKVSVRNLPGKGCIFAIQLRATAS